MLCFGKLRLHFPRDLKEFHGQPELSDKSKLAANHPECNREFRYLFIKSPYGQTLLFQSSFELCQKARSLSF